MRLDDRNLVAIDVETSGVNPITHDALALALVPIDRRLPELEVFINHPELEWNDFAQMNFLNFHSEWKLRAVQPMTACSVIEDYVHRTFGGAEITLVGHNVGFDIAFSRKLAAQGHRDQLAGISHRALDTHTLLYLLYLQGRIPGYATSSDGAFRYFEIGRDEGRRHTAMYDARATRDLFLRITDLLIPELQQENPAPSKLGRENG